ncbi:conjugal transfer protein [Pseudomonas luteola]|uniref:Conjugal transfer protein n=2 Tax=Pseudomonas TaxID=286 RepID=A0A2X2BZ02_PSELU|nr:MULTISPECIES: lytic transglycosylase domain-containing protein [Pseudomonas]MBA1250158.1 lytic transglycosylase domain-containing protein [Pseudomonas zeshuii]MBH3440909.1 lytic transglycosylase domain-containing protein [Pseudomonas luteola]SPY99991.1 conjugal transfer protein [Pseudomonas luteola]
MLIGWAKPFVLALVTVVASSFAVQTMAAPLVPLTAQCVETAAKRNGIHPDILWAILMVEGGSVGRNSKANTNGTYDIGPFQINSTHRQTIAQHGIPESVLRNNGCVNAEVAAWHLSQTLTDEVLSSVTDDESYLRAIARYHSATPQYNIIYAKKLRIAFERIYASQEAK